MKMTKILLTAALLISARAFAQEAAQTVSAAPAATEAVKTGFIARARAADANLVQRHYKG